MVSDNDLAVAIVIALVMIIIILCVWPGVARIRARDLAGFWGSSSGALYEIRPTTGRDFEVAVSGAGPDSRPGHISGLRGVRVGGTPSLAGNVELGGRRIHWRDGGVWHRQGVK